MPPGRRASGGSSTGRPGPRAGRRRFGTASLALLALVDGLVGEVVVLARDRLLARGGADDSPGRPDSRGTGDGPRDGAGLRDLRARRGGRLSVRPILGVPPEWRRTDLSLGRRILAALGLVEVAGTAGGLSHGHAAFLAFDRPPRSRGSSSFSANRRKPSWSGPTWWM